MKCLIPTEPDDTQAIVVQLALEQLGHQVRLFFTADMPSMQKNSVYMSNLSYYWNSSDQYHDYDENDYDVVWWRRARKPYVFKNSVHPDDFQFTKRENLFFYESLTANIAPKAWWVNSKEAARKAQFKLVQLTAAKSAGLIIPETLCTNDAKAIKDFLKIHHQSGVIYKPLSMNYWLLEDKAKLIYTTRVHESNLPTVSLMQLVPGIYQKEIKKKYELRVTCFGDFLVAAKICSQDHPKGLIDWRAIPKMQVPIEPYILPEILKKRIRLLMRQLGLVFGCLDFIVSEDGDYIFLEVNEQGQFLWLEELNTDFPMLDIFIHFLLSCKREFYWRPHERQLSLEDYEQEVHRIFNQNIARHVERNSFKAMREFNHCSY